MVQGRVMTNNGDSAHAGLWFVVHNEKILVYSLYFMCRNGAVYTTAQQHTELTTITVVDYPDVRHKLCPFRVELTTKCGVTIDWSWVMTSNRD